MIIHLFILSSAVQIYEFSYIHYHFCFYLKIKHKAVDTTIGQNFLDEFKATCKNSSESEPQHQTVICNVHRSVVCLSSPLPSVLSSFHPRCLSLFLFSVFFLSLFAILEFIAFLSNTNNIILYLTIIPRARVGYEMIDSQRGA